MASCVPQSGLPGYPNLRFQENTALCHEEPESPSGGNSMDYQVVPRAHQGIHGIAKPGNCDSTKARNVH